MSKKSNVPRETGPYLITNKELDQLKKNNELTRQLLVFITSKFDITAPSVLQYINESLFRDQCILTKIETIK